MSELIKLQFEELVSINGFHLYCKHIMDSFSAESVTKEKKTQVEVV